MKNKPPILLVEDDQVDALTVKRALRDVGVSNKLVHVENGEEAINFLKTNTKQRPCIILLDLNMPKMNGIEFLQLANKDESIKSIPIVVLTTSTDQEDRLKIFKHSVAGYMVKSIDYNSFVEMMKTITKYWVHSQLP